MSRIRPDLPPSLNDRAQDNWEPLLAIAEAGGGPWPDLARKTAIKLSGVDNLTMSVGTELLSDIREIFETKRVGRITTADLLAALHDDDEKPWSSYNRGKPMSPRQLARKLNDYGVKSKNLKIRNGDVKKGYDLFQFREVFSRYLSSPPEKIRYPLHARTDAAFTVADSDEVAATTSVSATNNHQLNQTGSGVADRRGGMERNIIEVEI